MTEKANPDSQDRRPSGWDIARWGLALLVALSATLFYGPPSDLGVKSPV